MKNGSIVVALIVGVSLMVSTAFIASAIKEYGRSLERAASAQRPASWPFPDHITLSLESGKSPVRFAVNSTP
jgi:hypothetical protein